MIVRLIRGVVWGLSILGFAVYVWLGVQRMTYPLELDCIEGVMMDHVVRLAHGQPIYVKPTLEYIPLAYMPLFSVVASFVTRLAGHPEFWQARLVSFVSSLGIALLGGWIVWAETRRRTPALAAAAIYPMALGLTGGCYDVGRPDSMMLLLSLAGLATLRFTSTTLGAVAAALLLTLGFFTKQHAILFAFAALIHLALNDRRRVVPFAIAIVAGCGGGYALLTLWLGEWFPFFTWNIPRGWSQFSPVRILHYVGAGVFGALACMTVPTLFSLALPDRPWLGRNGLWMWAALAAFGTGLMATLDPYAYRHVLTPTVVILGIVGPLSLVRLGDALDRRGPTPGWESGWGARISTLLLAAQFLPLFYPVHDQLPHPRAREASDELRVQLRAIDGPVLLPYHGFYTWQSGRGTSLDIIAFDDIARSRGNSLLRKDPHFLDRMFEPLHSGPGRPTLVMDVPLAAAGPLWASLEPYYKLRGPLGWISEPLRPVTGNRYTPTWVYVPAEDSTGGVRGPIAGATEPLAK